MFRISKSRRKNVDPIHYYTISVARCISIRDLNLNHIPDEANIT